MDIYVYFSDGTDNGKTFTSIEEAMKYLYQQAHHSKVHLGGILKDMRVTETTFTLYIEKYQFLRGRVVEEIGIRITSKDDAKRIKSYFEINKI